MAIYPKYVVDKDWDSQQITDIVSYKGAGQNFTFGTDGFASIYETILDANDIAVPGAVGADPTTPSPVPYTEARQTIFVVKGDFEEDVLAAADAKYTLDFQSIYGAPEAGDEDLRTKFVGSIVSEEPNDVGIRVSSGEVFFGAEAVIVDDEITNRTTITLNRTVNGDVGKHADSEFVVGGDVAATSDGTATATANIKNADITVANWVWVGSAWGSFETANDAVRYTLNLEDSTVTGTTLQVRHTGELKATNSTFAFKDMILRGDATFDKTTITLSTYISNVYGENNCTATLTLKNGSTLTSTTDLQIGKPDGGDDVKRAGALVLNASSIGYATVIPDNPDTTNVDESATVITRSGNIAVKQNGSITMDAASKIYASALTNDGAINITIDAAGEDWINATSFNNTAETGKINIAGSFAGGVKRVIYATAGEVKVADIVVTATSTDEKPVTAATRGGKVALAAGVDYTTLYLSNDINEDDDFAKEVKDTTNKSYYVDFNAFQLPKSALEDGVKPVTKTILIDGTDREHLDYVGTTTASIDGLTFAKDGTNAVAEIPAVEDDPTTTDVDETAAAVDAVPEENVKFVLSGMEPTDPESYRELKKGITVEEGVTFTADKLYQSGKDAVTTIKGELKMGTYATGLEDIPETTDVDESVAPDTFQVAGGKVNVTSTGSLTGAGIVSVIATLRDDAGKPIKAEMNVTGAPIDLSKLEIGANSTVTLTDIEANEDGTSKAVFGNVVMRKTNVSDFTGPVLTIINSQVDVTNSFDTTKGLVNINFQSQLFVKTATATIEGGTLNLTVTDEDVTLLSNYGKTDPATGELVVPQPKMFYTIVHAAISNEVVLTCDGDVDGDGYIDGTKYIYTDLGGQGLYVMHEDVAKTLYVNVAWKNASTGDIVGEGMFYNINAFSTFTDALNVAKDNDNYDTSITVLSNVTETYGADLFYKDDDGAPVYFNSNITVKAGVFDVESGTVSYPTENPASWTVQYVNTAAGRMDLCISPAGAVEDDTETTDIDESKPAKTFVVENGVKIFMGGEAPALPEPIVSGPAGIWLDFWGQGAGVTVNSDVTADMVGAKGTATITADATITAHDLVIRAGEKGENKTVTITGDPTATTAQITVSCLNFVDGILNVTDSVVVSDRLLFTDDNVIGKQVQSGDDPVVVTSGSFVLNSDNTVWTVSSTDGVYNYFYKDHPADAEGEPTFTATLNFTNGSVLDTKAINNVIAGASVNADEGWTYAGHATPMTLNFEGSDLIVGTTVSNAGVITFTGKTTTEQVQSENPDDPNTPIVTEQEVVVRSTANITGELKNNAGGVITITDSTVTAGSVLNRGTTAAPATITVGENGVLSAGSVSNSNNTAGAAAGILNVIDGGTVSQTGGRIYNYGTMNLNDAKFQTSEQKIQNMKNCTININGAVTFINGEDTVRGSITNYSVESQVHKDAIINMGVSNTGTGAATVNVNIIGGTVAFSAADLSFDWAVTGVTGAGTPNEAIASAKLSGGTIFVDKAGITLTDSGFEVPATTEEPIVPAHTVYNDTNSIKMANGGVLTLDLGEAVVGGQTVYNNLNWTVQNLTLVAGGMLNMDYKQILTVKGDLVAPQTDPATVALTVDIDGAEDLDGDKLVIAWDGFVTGPAEEPVYADYSWVAESDCFVIHAATDPKKGSTTETYGITGLYLDSSRFLKVSQHHAADPANGWYQDVNAAAASSGTRVRILEGEFGGGSYLNGKNATVVGNYSIDAGDPPVTYNTLQFNGALVAGYDVSTLTKVEGVPAILNMKIVEGNTNLTVKAGTNAVFKSRVVGGDLVRLSDGSGQIPAETKVNYYRVGNTNLTINGGDFNYTTAGSARQIIGGLAYASTTGIGMATLSGDVNLTITGGTFKGYNIYGGNWASSRAAGKNTRIDGNVTISIDTTAGAIALTDSTDTTAGGSIYAGSMGTSTITGNTLVKLSGAGSLTGKTLWGGCDGDFTQGSTGKIETFVDGERILSFTGFEGGLAFSKIEDFSKVTFEGDNKVIVDDAENFAMSDSFNYNVKTWEIAGGATIANFVFDFAGDTLNINMGNYALGEDGWSFLGNGASVAGFEGLKVAFNGGTAVSYADGAWTDTVNHLKLESDGWKVSAALA